MALASSVPLCYTTGLGGRLASMPFFEEIWLIAIKGSANSIFAHTSPSEQMIALHKLLWEI